MYSGKRFKKMRGQERGREESYTNSKALAYFIHFMNISINVHLDRNSCCNGQDSDVWGSISTWDFNDIYALHHALKRRVKPKVIKPWLKLLHFTQAFKARIPQKIKWSWED